MKGCLIEDYANPSLKMLARGVLQNFLLNKEYPFPVIFDASTIHYKKWTNIVFNPRAKSSWKAILEQYYNTDAYKTLNDVINGDPLLSKYATVHFLNSLHKEIQWNKNEIPQKETVENAKNANEIENFFEALDNSTNPIQTNKIVNSIAKQLENEAKEIAKDIEVAQSFSHIGIPVAEFLEKADEFRIKARNRIIINLLKLLQAKKQAPSLKQAKMPTLIGGRPVGVKKLQRFGELPKLLPLELVNGDLLDYKIASKTAKVSESYGSIQNYVIYLDKSGSMSDDIKYVVSSVKTEKVPKISFACAAVLALANALKRLGAKMTLKFFDVEVQRAIKNFEEIIDTLLKIRADNGTNITKVLEDAITFRDERIIVVTDGIDEVDEEVVKKTRHLDITFVFIDTDNELLSKNFKHVYVKEAKPDILLKI
ncbi:MAG: hypothetical protein QXT31_03465 [Candidatus Bathyarchaeia archaeon]